MRDAEGYTREGVSSVYSRRIAHMQDNMHLFSFGRTIGPFYLPKYLLSWHLGRLRVEAEQRRSMIKYLLPNHTNCFPSHIASYTLTCLNVFPDELISRILLLSILLVYIARADRKPLGLIDIGLVALCQPLIFSPFGR